MEPLARLLEEAHDGRIQVPEFQRELILTDEWMKSLLASVSLGYPIGAVTLLEAGSREMRFESTSIADPPLSSHEPERLLIDGRRRITGLYQALASGRPVEIRDGADAERRRWRDGFAGHGGAEAARDRLMGRFETKILAAFDGYVVPTIPLRKETTRWSVRVHGGSEGRRLSDRFREAAG